ncbi:MAG: histidine--tRNA ligase [Elusimicrobia bacterium]|nr:histidine--tRNA ligase [Elusimicrobiota bacterium]
MPIPTTPPSGFRDFLPEQVAARHDAIETISRVYRSFGFQPIQTSAVEDLQVLLGKGGGENEKLIFKIQKRGEALERAKAEGTDLADLGLRFDLTLPLARYYSKHGSLLPHPFKAFHLGPVWRAERAQKGRYREFTQCDVDIVGADSWGAEVEVITAILAVFRAFGLDGVEVHLNDRRLVDVALEAAQVPPEKRGAVCVIVDKLDKMDEAKVRAELEAEVGVEAAALLAQTILAKTPSGEFVRQIGKDGFDGLNRIMGAVQATTPGAVIHLTPNLMRGLGYYTGPVFEFRHASLSGSLGGGGRYDKLTAAFGGQPVPACGGSIGFERLMLILEEKGRGTADGAPDAVVTVFSDELRARSLEVAAALRAKGLSVDVFPGAAKLKQQFKYADQKKAHYALVIGPDEAERGVVQVKSLSTGDESALSVDEACAKIAARA